MMFSDNCRINYSAWNSSCVQKLFFNFKKKMSHEITKVSVLASSLWDSTIIPEYEIIKSRIRLFILGFPSACGKARVRL